MTRRQEQFINDAKKNLEQARQWLDIAMYYSGEEMPEKDFEKVRNAYDKICSSIDSL